MQTAYYHLPGLFANCIAYFCLYSGNIENIFMTGAGSVLFMGLPQIVSGAAEELALGNRTRRRFFL